MNEDNMKKTNAHEEDNGGADNVERRRGNKTRTEEAERKLHTWMENSFVIFSLRVIVGDDHNWFVGMQAILFC